MVNLQIGAARVAFCIRRSSFGVLNPDIRERLCPYMAIRYTRSYRALRNGSFGGTLFQALRARLRSVVVPMGRFQSSQQHLAKACCEMSRRDGAIVARHGVPGICCLGEKQLPPTGEERGGLAIEFSGRPHRVNRSALKHRSMLRAILLVVVVLALDLLWGVKRSARAQLGR